MLLHFVASVEDGPVLWSGEHARGSLMQVGLSVVLRGVQLQSGSGQKMSTPKDMFSDVLQYSSSSH